MTDPDLKNPPCVISVEELEQASSLIQGALSRVEREQGANEAVRAAIKNIHGNLAYLAGTLDPVSAFKVLSDAQTDLVQSMWEDAHPLPHDWPSGA